MEGQSTHFPQASYTETQYMCRYHNMYTYTLLKMGSCDTPLHGFTDSPQVLKVFNKHLKGVLTTVNTQYRC